MIPLQKPFFRLISQKNCLCNCFAGAHTGAPLQRLLKRFNTVVGADRCVRPEKQNGTSCQENIAITTFFMDIFGKSSNISLTGGHTGSPIQRLGNSLNRDVGEYLCVRPQKNSRDDVFGIQSKKRFFSETMI